MSKTDKLVYKPLAGESIDYAAEQAIALAKKEDKTVTFQFNSVSLTATAANKPQDVVSSYMDTIHKQAEAYRNSPQGKAAAARRDAEVISKQALINDLVDKRLDAALKQGLTAVIQWVKEYANVADDVGVDHQGKKVSSALTAAGYKESDYVGDKFVKGDKEVMGRYIVGQVIHCLNSGMPPHPMAANFADDYLKMPDNPAPGATVRPPMPKASDKTGAPGPA
jgi:hypothetical protein